MSDSEESKDLSDVAFGAAAVAHIERILVEENLRLRRERALALDDLAALQQADRSEVVKAGEIARLRIALATITWTDDLEEVHTIAQTALEGGEHHGGDPTPDHDPGGAGDASADGEGEA